LYSDENEDLWEPFNAKVLAQSNVELTEADWEELVFARSNVESSDGEGEIDPERPENREGDREGEICLETVR
jgi:hypothetical protein